MGLEIKKNKAGLYKVKNTVSDEKYFGGKWVTEDEVKKMLIEKKIWEFLEGIAKVEMEFPLGWHVNEKIVAQADGKKRFAEWWLEKAKLSNDQFSEAIYGKAIEVVKKYDLKEYITPLLEEDLEK